MISYTANYNSNEQKEEEENNACAPNELHSYIGESVFHIDTVNVQFITS